MIFRRKFLPVILSGALLLSLFTVAPARADEFTKISLDNIVKTLVRFGAIDIRKDDVIDIYGRIVECKIYTKYYKDDFQWERVRKALRETIRQDVKTFPTAYRYDAVLQLERYDFDSNMYRFTDKTAQTKTNTFVVETKEEDYCTNEDVENLPVVYRFVLDESIGMPGLPISPEEGKILLQRMNENKNEDRLVYTRFNFYVVYIAPIAKLKGNKNDSQKGKKTESFGLMVAQDPSKGVGDINARLDSIEYFEDQERTKLIYVYRP